MRVTATHLGVHVVDRDGTRNAHATAEIKSQRQIKLALLRNAITFQPDLRVELSGRDLRRGAVVCAKFQIWQGQSLRWKGFQPQPYSDRIDDFLPNNNLLDLSRFGGQLLGVWILRASIAGFRMSEIQGQDPASVKLFIEELNYAEVGNFSWGIVQRQEALITATGEFTRQTDPESLRAVEVALDQI